MSGTETEGHGEPVRAKRLACFDPPSTSNTVPVAPAVRTPELEMIRTTPLTPEAEIEICEWFANGHSVELLARRHKMSVAQVRQLIVLKGQGIVDAKAIVTQTRKLGTVDTFHILNKANDALLLEMVQQKQLKPSESIALKKNLEAVNPDRVLTTSGGDSVSPNFHFDVKIQTGRAETVLRDLDISAKSTPTAEHEDRLMNPNAYRENAID